MVCGIPQVAIFNFNSGNTVTDLCSSVGSNLRLLVLEHEQISPTTNVTATMRQTRVSTQTTATKMIAHIGKSVGGGSSVNGNILLH